ncbi:MAG: sulfotransferase domain-containing protein [Caulobacteraceae bacterium]
MTIEAGRRARSMAELAELQGRFMTPPEIGASIASFRPRASDIIISPYGKCGTTWLQQSFHCLRTGGDQDFDDISCVVPWIETAGILGLDLSAEQRAEPRGFKSHLAWPVVPKGARYVVSLRDPKDALVSMYRFMEGWFLEPGAVAIGEFAVSWLERGQGRDYWSHLISWWEQRDNPDVLLVSYEQMSADPEAAVRRLAAFCGIALSERLLTQTLDMTSLAFMLAHKHRFDDALMRRASEARCGLPPGSDSAKVRAGRVGGHRRELPAEIGQALDAKWTEVVTPALGFADYAALDAALKSTAAHDSAAL